MAFYRTDEHRPMQHEAKSIDEFIEACRGYMQETGKPAENQGHSTDFCTMKNIVALIFH